MNTDTNPIPFLVPKTPVQLVVGTDPAILGQTGPESEEFSLADIELVRSDFAAGLTVQDSPNQPIPKFNFSGLVPAALQGVDRSLLQFNTLEKIADVQVGVATGPKRVAVNYHFPGPVFAAETPEKGIESLSYKGLKPALPHAQATPSEMQKSIGLGKTHAAENSALKNNFDLDLPMGTAVDTPIGNANSDRSAWPSHPAPISDRSPETFGPRVSDTVLLNLLGQPKDTGTSGAGPIAKPAESAAIATPESVPVLVPDRVMMQIPRADENVGEKATARVPLPTDAANTDRPVVLLQAKLTNSPQGFQSAVVVPVAPNVEHSQPPLQAARPATLDGVLSIPNHSTELPAHPPPTVGSVLVGPIANQITTRPETKVNPTVNPYQTEVVVSHRDAGILQTAGLPASEMSIEPLQTTAVTFIPSAQGDHGIVDGVLSPVELLPAEVKTASPHSVAERGALAQLPPETAQRTVQVIAQAAAQLSDRPVELLLNPEELGKVRLTLHANDGAMTVGVAVERQETLELLRQNIGQLAKQLREIGYQDLTFEFAGQGDFSNQTRDQRESDPTQMSAESNLPEAENNPSPLQLNISPQSGVDIRL